MFRPCFAALFMLASFGIWAAESTTTAVTTLYISDQLSIGLRAGAAREQKIINYAKAGEIVQVLDRAPGTGFVRVRASSGPEGWVEADKVVNTAPAVLRYAELETKYQMVFNELEELKVSSPDREVLQQQVDSLQKQVLQLENLNEKLAQSNAMLEQRFQSEVMYSGAIIVLIGTVLGFVVARVNKKRDSWR